MILILTLTRLALHLDPFLLFILLCLLLPGRLRLCLPSFLFSLFLHPVHKAANYDVRDVARLTSTALESVMEDVSNNKMGVKSREVDAAVLQVLESVRRAYLEAITDAYLDSIS